jgi:hypothetical protein
VNDHGRLERKIELVQGHGYGGFFMAVEFAVAELIGHREPLHIQLMSLSVVMRQSTVRDAPIRGLASTFWPIDHKKGRAEPCLLLQKTRVYY